MEQKEKFNQLITSINNEFTERFVTNLAFFKSNRVKSHSFTINEEELIKLGRLVHNNKTIVWTDNVEDNELINKEVLAFDEYFGDDEDDDFAFLSLGYNIASIIIKNPKFDDYYNIGDKYVYLFPTDRGEVFNTYHNEIKDYMINERSISEESYNKNIDNNEIKETFTYMFITEVLLNK